jgi:superfamily II DNA or RNA helicase
MTALGVRHTRILPGEYVSEAEYAYVGTIQSFMARRRRGLELANVKVIVIDEAHHATADTYQRLIALYPDAVIVGLTATPTRTDGKGLGDVFDDLIQAITYREAFEQGYLVRPKYYAPHTPDLEGVKTVAGDYSDDDLERVMNKPQLVGDIVQHYARYAGDRKGIVFATRVTHSIALCEAFSASGIPAFHIDGTTPTDERDALLEAFRSDAYQVMVNVAVATEGLDIPDISCVVMARPTKSPILHLQCLGRGLRTHPGKEDCMVLDHAGNVLRLGGVEEYEEWTLETGKGANSPKKKELKDPKEITCEQCSAIFYASRICPECGHEHVVMRRPEHVEVAEGELVELGSGKRAEYSMEQKKDWLAQLLYLAHTTGRREGWASHQYRAKFGVWPHKKQGVPPAPPSPEVLAFVDTQRRAFLAGRTVAAG